MQGGWKARGPYGEGSRIYRRRCILPMPSNGCLPEEYLLLPSRSHASPHAYGSSPQLCLLMDGKCMEVRVSGLGMYAVSYWQVQQFKR